MLWSHNSSDSASQPAVAAAWSHVFQVLLGICFLVLCGRSCFLKLLILRVEPFSYVFWHFEAPLFRVMSVTLNRQKFQLSKPHIYWPLHIWNECFSDVLLRVVIQRFQSSFSLSLFMTAAFSFYVAAHSDEIIHSKFIRSSEQNLFFVVFLL